MRLHHTLIAIGLVLAGLVAGCGSSHAATDAGSDAGEPMLRPAAECAPECGPGGPPPPPGLSGPSVCYDGCNWCLCTTAGPMGCTARGCSDP